MNLKAITLASVIAAGSVSAGERVENEQYRLPEGGNPTLLVACQDTDELESWLDNLKEYAQLYITTRQMVVDCTIFNPLF